MASRKPKPAPKTASKPAPKPAPKPAQPAALGAPARIAPPRRRLKRFALGSVLFLLGLVLLGPLVAGPLLRGRVVAGLNQRLNAQASLAEFGFHAAGGLHIGGLSLSDYDGRPLLSLDRLDANIGVLAALTGSYRATLSIDGLEVHVRRAADGSWDLTQLVKQDEERGQPQVPEPEDPESEEAAEGLPDLRVHLKLQNSRIVIHGPGGETELVDVNVGLDLDDWNADAPLSMKARVRGPQGEAGALSLQGSLSFDPDASLGIEAISGSITAVIEELSLAALQPAAALATTGPMPIDGSLGDGRFEGSLVGHTKIELGRNRTLELEGNFALSGVQIDHLPGTRAPVSLPAATLELTASLDEAGTGPQLVKLEAPDLFALRVESSASHLNSARGGLNGQVTLEGHVPGLSHLARSFVPLKDGLDFDGDLSGGFEWQAVVGTKGFFGGSLDARFSLADFTTRNAQGGELDLGELESVDLKLGASLDLDRGEASLSKLDLSAGPITARGYGGLAGLSRDWANWRPSQLQVADSKLELDANLDRLADLMGKIADLGELSFGGDIQAVSEAKQEGDRILFTTHAELRELTVQNLEVTGTKGVEQRNLGPLDATLEQTARIDTQGSGSLTLSKFQLRSDFLRFDAGGELFGIADPETLAGELHHEVVVLPVRAAGALKNFLFGYTIGGQDLRQKQSLRFDGSRVSISGELTVPALRIDGPDLGSTGLQLEGLACTFAGEGDRLKEELSSYELELSLESLASAFPALEEGADSELALGLSALELGLKGELREGRAQWDSRALVGLLRARGGGLGEEPLELTQLSFNADENVADLEAGSLSLPDFELRSDFLNLDATALLSGLNGELAKTQPEGSLQIHVRAEPQVLGERFASFLEGTALSGSPLEGTFKLDGHGERFDFEGELAGEHLSIWLPAEVDASGGELRPARSVDQEDYRLVVDVMLQRGVGIELLDLRKLNFRSRTARAELNGGLSNLSDRSRMRADLELSFSSEIERLIADLGALVDFDGYAGKGTLQADYSIKGDEGELGMTGVARIDGLELKLTPPDAAPGSDPIVVSDPKLSFDLDLTIDTENMDLGIRRCALASEIIWGSLEGQFSNLLAAASGEESQAVEAVDEAGGEAQITGAMVEGLRGEFSYVPDRLGVVLAPWLPGVLSGEKEEKIVFDFTGSLADLSHKPFGSLEGRATFGLGRFVGSGFDAAGQLSLELDGDAVSAKGDLAANGGTLNLDTRFDLRGPQSIPTDTGAEAQPRSWIKLDLSGVKTNPELSPILAMLHPAFAVVDKTRVGSVTGLIDGELELTYDAPLSKAQLDAGWAALPKLPINGHGRIDIQSASIAGSPLLTQILSALGGSEEEIDIDPISFIIERGRLRYSKPWQWTISGAKTTFGGSIGLDETLDLSWNILVDEKLVDKHRFLRTFEGETIGIPIGGTAYRPKLELSSTLRSLAAQAAERELRRKLGLGGGSADGEVGEAEGDGAAEGAGDGDEGGILDGLGSNEEKAQKLFEEANTLYEAGKQAEAAVLYKKIRKEYKNTLTYLINKSKIKRRAKKGEPE